MDFHGVLMKGEIIVHVVNSLPVWTATDEGRIIYVESDDTFYFGTSSEWTSFFGFRYIVVDGQEQITVTTINDTLTFVAGDGLEIETDDTAKTLTFTLSDNVLKKITVDGGDEVTPVSNEISFVGGEGVNVTADGAVITIAGEDATNDNKGVVKFVVKDFAVSSGEVSLQITGSPVGTSDAQTLTNKSIDEYHQYTAFTPQEALSTGIVVIDATLANRLVLGMGLKYKIGTTYYYGICQTLTANQITIYGGWSTGGTISELWYDESRTKTFQLIIPVNGYYEEASDTALILNYLNYYYLWQKTLAYCVKCLFYPKIIDTGATKGKINIKINGNDIITTSGGLSLATNATLFSTTNNIDTSNYDINFNERLEISVTKGTNGDAEDLTVTLVFVCP